MPFRCLLFSILHRLLLVKNQRNWCWKWKQKFSISLDVTHFLSMTYWRLWLVAPVLWEVFSLLEVCSATKIEYLYMVRINPGFEFFTTDCNKEFWDTNAYQYIRFDLEFRVFEYRCWCSNPSKTDKVKVHRIRNQELLQIYPNGSNSQLLLCKKRHHEIHIHWWHLVAE